MTYYMLPLTRKHFFKISSNSEANASELQENLKEMFPRYYMRSEICSSLKSHNSVHY